MLKGSLKWCLKESKSRKLLEAIQQHKSAISLALLSDVSRDLKDIKKDVNSIRETYLNRNNEKFATGSKGTTRQQITTLPGS
jgi:hypothetical protein